MKRHFRLSAWVLLAGVTAAATATHRATDLADADDGRIEQRVVSTHDPSSHALHLHAVQRIVEDAPCWACHSHRFSILSGSAPMRGPFVASTPLGATPPRAAPAVARYYRPCRAPPPLPRPVEI